MNKEKPNNQYALFLGCVMPIQLPHLEALGREILKRLDIDVVDLDFSCCPVYSVKDVDKDEWLVFAARNLALAEEHGVDIISFCNGCTQTLIEATHELNEDKELRKKINTKLAKIGKQYKGKVKSSHIMMIFDQYKDKLGPLLTKSLRGWNIATHTGCHLLRPSEIIGYDSAENPQKFDDLVRFVGGYAVDYQTKTLCCGSSQVTNDQQIMVDIMTDKLDDLTAANVDTLVTCCPSCFLQYDKTQMLVNRQIEHTDYAIPVLHVFQLVGLALGMSPDEVFLSHNRSFGADFIERLDTLESV